MKKSDIKVDSSMFSMWWKEPKTSPVTIIGMDPALKTFGWNIVKFYNRKRYEVIKDGHLKSAIILDGKVSQEIIKAVVYDLSQMVNNYDILSGATERITNRGGIGVTLRCIEQMNLLIGAIMMSSNIPFQMIPASVWKKELIPESSGKKNRDYFPDVTNDHRRDAGCIALYSYSKLVESGLIKEVP